MEYIINPVLMGGLVKEVNSEFVKVHLHGRLGVITVPHRLIITDEPIVPGHELRFYFSYIQINEQPYDYDVSPVDPALAISPSLVGGTLTEVNDTAIKLEMMAGLGTVAVPRRWVFTPVTLQVGQTGEFYFSCMEKIGKREIPVESI